MRYVPYNSQKSEALTLTTSTGKPIPTMERSQALAQGLIPGRAQKLAKPLYDVEVTLPFVLSTEKNMLIHACDTLAQGNHCYLVVYDRFHATIYKSTSLRETVQQLTPEERGDITSLFSEVAPDTSGLSIQSEEELKIAGWHNS